jgi:hypothetical protein
MSSDSLEKWLSQYFLDQARTDSDHRHPSRPGDQGSLTVNPDYLHQGVADILSQIAWLEMENKGRLRGGPASVRLEVVVSIKDGKPKNRERPGLARDQCLSILL